MSYAIIEKLKKDIEEFKKSNLFEQVGIVKEAGDGIVYISGLREATSQELLLIETEDVNIPSLALNLEETLIGAVVLGEHHRIKVGSRVRKTGKILAIKVSDELKGRVIDPLGNVLDDKGILFKEPEKVVDYFLERPAPSVIDREPVNTPLHTGIKAIDSMIPIGRGQRELIIGDRQTGKTALALDAIINQQQDTPRRQVICIYVAIGQKNAKIARIIKQLEEYGAMPYTIVVSAHASSPAVLQYLAPFTGCAIGEYFMDRGQDALVIYDDLSKHADAYRQLSLLLRRPPGREAYPGDIFYLHARLLERAAKLSSKKGGGSLTALPIIETKLGDVSSYIPTNVISITDGQIYLESDLFHKGIRPAINVGLSVSRVGSAAQTKAMKKVAAKLRLDLAQFRELQAFVQFTADLDENTRNQIKKGQLLTEILKQVDLSPMPFEFQTIIIYAATNGYLDDIPLERIGRFEKDMIEYLDKLRRKDILDPLKTNGELNEKLEDEIKNMLSEFKNKFNISYK